MNINNVPHLRVANISYQVSHQKFTLGAQTMCFIRYVLVFTLLQILQSYIMRKYIDFSILDNCRFSIYTELSYIKEIGFSWLFQISKDNLKILPKFYFYCLDMREACSATFDILFTQGGEAVGGHGVCHGHAHGGGDVSPHLFVSTSQPRRQKHADHQYFQNIQNIRR